MEVKGLAAVENVPEVDGLTGEQVRESRAKYGSNELTPPKRTPIWKRWLAKFNDPTIVILCVCAGIAVALGVVRGGMPWDGVAILIAVTIATLGGTWSEYKADRAFELLKRDGDRIPVKVRRDGAFHQILSPEVVVGDVIYLEGGDRVPADGVLARACDAQFDESLMTGESEPVLRQIGARATGGTHLLSGSATLVVDKVGDATELGLLASALGRPWVCQDARHRKYYRGPGVCEVCGAELREGQDPPTPLQRRLSGLTDSISAWGTIGAVMIFVALVVCQAVSICRTLDGTWMAMLSNAAVWPLLVFVVLGVVGLKILSHGRKALWGSVWLGLIGVAVGCAWLAGTEALTSVQQVMQFFMVSVTIVVVAVPEGLPLAIVIALGLGMRKIREDNNLVRKMVATETIGSATVICSDKTGTLTLNRMTVVRRVRTGALPEAEAERLLDLCALVNSTAELECTANGERVVGNPTEGALLVEARLRGTDYHALRTNVRLLDRVNFSSDRKTMSSLVESEGEVLLLVKGAPERVFERCGQVPAEFSAGVQSMAAEAVRALALAYRRMPLGTTRISPGDELGLEPLGLIGLADPLREDVPLAIARCAKAGIDVKMITGDHPLTAHAIAEKAGMLRGGDLEMTGEEFAAASDEDLLARLPRLRVIARARPENKVRLVELLQRVGEVVAMTGDGTNDAPALKKADVGVSMGLRGTDVAKQASDIVLTDDNFGSIVKAVHWGRTLYENLQKFVQFQLTVNLSALGIAFISPIVATLFPHAGFEIQPLTVLQYLWINLIMDTLAAIAFGLEPPRPETLEMAPKRSGEPFLTPTMLGNICVLGIYFILLILAVEKFDLLGISAYREAANYSLLKASVVFNCYVWFQIFHMFNARSVQRGASAFDNILRSRSFFAIMGLVAVIQFCMVQFGGAALGTAALPFVVWIKILLLGATAVAVGEGLRAVQRLFFRRCGVGTV